MNQEIYQSVHPSIDSDLLWYHRYLRLFESVLRQWYLLEGMFCRSMYMCSKSQLHSSAFTSACILALFSVNLCLVCSMVFSSTQVFMFLLSLNFPSGILDFKISGGGG